MPNRSGRGRSRACRLPRAASRRSARLVWLISSVVRPRWISCCERQRLAWKGEGQIVLISGEAGIGKSRLAAALAERVARQPHTQFRYQCSPYHANSALHPIIDQLERAAGFKADDTSELRLDKLEALLALGTTQVQAVAPLFAALLSIPFGDRYPQLAFSPAQQRRRTLAALLDQFESSCAPTTNPVADRRRAMGRRHLP